MRLSEEVQPFLQAAPLPSRGNWPCCGKKLLLPIVSLLCVVQGYLSTWVFRASLSTVCKKGTKNDEAVSQINVAMVAINALLTFGENAHAQPHLTVYLQQLCTSVSPAVSQLQCWVEATLTTGENSNNRAVCCCYEQISDCKCVFILNGC